MQIIADKRLFIHEIAKALEIPSGLPCFEEIDLQKRHINY
jgi:hypothetical protein